MLDFGFWSLGHLPVPLSGGARGGFFGVSWSTLQSIANQNKRCPIVGMVEIALQIAFSKDI